MAIRALAGLPTKLFESSIPLPHTRPDDFLSYFDSLHWDCQVTTSKQCILVAPSECTKGKLMREVDRVGDNGWHFRRGRPFLVCEVPKVMHKYDKVST